jgi:AcrR family transcriptional regulator
MENKHVERSRITRERLLAHARVLFGERGYAAVGTEEIVRAAGVTRGALYHQFRDKEALFAAVVEAVEAETTARVAAGAASAADPLEELRIGCRAFLAEVADPHVERILLLDAPAVLGWDRWREISLRHGLGLVTAVLAAAMDAGVIVRQPAAALAHLLIGAVDAGAMLVARADDRDAARAEVYEVMDRLLAALATDDSGAASRS